jgi:hypothetical protein
MLSRDGAVIFSVLHEFAKGDESKRRLLREIYTQNDRPQVHVRGRSRQTVIRSLALCTIVQDNEYTYDCGPNETSDETVSYLVCIR